MHYWTKFVQSRVLHELYTCKCKCTCTHFGSPFPDVMFAEPPSRMPSCPAVLGPPLDPIIRRNHPALAIAKRRKINSAASRAVDRTAAESATRVPTIKMTAHQSIRLAAPLAVTGSQLRSSVCAPRWTESLGVDGLVERDRRTSAASVPCRLPAHRVYVHRGS